MSIHRYLETLDNKLSQICLNNVFHDCDLVGCNESLHKTFIDDYYNSVISCVLSATAVISRNKLTAEHDYNIPGWNDIVREKHDVAKVCFHTWAVNGKPRHGQLFADMQRSRAYFKQALRYCR